MDLSAAHIADNARFSEARLLQIDLHGAHVGHRLVLDGAVIAKEANFESMQIASRASFKGGTFEGPVNLHNTKIGDRLGFGGATLKGVLDLSRVQVDDSVLLGNHSDDPAATSKFFGVIELDGAKIGRGLWLAEAEFHDKLSIVGSTIEDELNFGIKNNHWAKWQKGSELDLHDSSAGQLIADMNNSWPAPSGRHLDGFKYRALCTDPSPTGDKCEVKKDTIGLLKTWLSQERTAQPYEQLASVLADPSLHDEHVAIQFAGREVEREESHGLRWIWLTVLRWTIGYGFHPEYLAVLAIGLIGTGVVVLRRSGAVRDYELELSGAIYTVDMFLPLVRLNERHYTDVDLEGGTQYYFYFLKIAGFVLGPAGIAGLLAR